jgi:hypothetical protein
LKKWSIVKAENGYHVILDNKEIHNLKSPEDCFCLSYEFMNPDSPPLFIHTSLAETDMDDIINDLVVPDHMPDDL